MKMFFFRVDVADGERGVSWRSPVAAINLVQLNRSITHQHCVSADCSGPDGDAFGADYHLSLHPHFPLAFVTLQFQYAFLHYYAVAVHCVLGLF